MLINQIKARICICAAHARSRDRIRRSAKPISCACSCTCVNLFLLATGCGVSDWRNRGGSAGLLCTYTSLQVLMCTYQLVQVSGSACPDRTHGRQNSSGEPAQAGVGVRLPRPPVQEQPVLHSLWGSGVFCGWSRCGLQCGPEEAEVFSGAHR